MPASASLVSSTPDFWSTLKNEYYHRHVFATIADARRGVYAWIDGWYNARRRHSAIGQITPNSYENTYAAARSATLTEAA